jgi:hypothetical protein
MKAPTAKIRREVTERVNALCREHRPSLLEFMLTGFWKLEALPASVVKDAAARRYYHAGAGWTVPDDSMGRKGHDGTEEAARITSESIRIWINKHLGDVVPASMVAVTVEMTGDWAEIVIYRKAT